MEDKITKTGKDSLSYQYFTDKAEKFSNAKRQLTPELLMFVNNLLYSHKKTRQQAIEYVMQRQMMNHDMRRHSISFLKQVNHFLNSNTDKEIANILRNPKDKLSLYKKVEMIIDRVIADPEAEKHKRNYILGIKNLLKKEAI